jgi:hypothetical protein
VIRAQVQPLQHAIHRRIQVGPQFSDKWFLMIFGDDPGPRRLVPGQTAFLVLLPSAARAGIIAAKLAHTFLVFAFNGAKPNRGWKILQ